MLFRISSSLLLLTLVACGGAIEPEEDDRVTEEPAMGHEPERADPEPAEVAAAPRDLSSDECAAGERLAPCTDAAGADGICRCANGARSSVCARVAADWSGCDPRELPDPCAFQPTPGGGDRRPTCILDGDTWRLDQDICNTPLVLSFEEGDGARVAFTHPRGSFDLVGVGASFETDWVSAATPWLALDRDGNGRIDDGSELFGSMTQLGARRAINGFEALAALDDDHDGRITAADVAFDQLLLWSDENQDRVSSKSELVSLASRGVVAIELDYRVERHCSGTACEVERARFTFAGSDRVRSGHVVDVHFAVTR